MEPGGVGEYVRVKSKVWVPREKWFDAPVGVDSGTLGKFVPVVLDFIQSKGRASVAGLLKGLWK